MLDMALERFMKCPIEDKSVQALLYHLGLDFERKRMFNKALAVYNHILKAGAFKDIKRRINNLKKIENTLVLSAGQKKRETALFLIQPPNRRSGVMKSSKNWGMVPWAPFIWAKTPVSIVRWPSKPSVMPM
jgi:hypothetical protein